MGGSHQEMCFPSIDTLVGGRLAKAFEKDPLNQFSRRRIVAQSGDTIFVWSRNTLSHGYKVLYNFSLGVGDTVVYYPYNIFHEDTVRYVIDSLYWTNVDGQQLRTQRVKIIYDPAFITTGIIIERMGMVQETYLHSNGFLEYRNTHFLLDERNTLDSDGLDFMFCKFQNDVFEYHSPASVCDVFLNSEEQISSTSTILLYPNPNNGTFSLQIEQAVVESLNGYDISSRRVDFVQMGSNTFTEIQSLSPGLYFLEIRFKNGKISRTKLLRL